MRRQTMAFNQRDQLHGVQDEQNWSQHRTLRHTEGQWLVNQVKSQSHHAQLVYQKNLETIYSTMKTEDTEALGRHRAKPSRIKARYSRLTSFFQYSHSSRPTSHLRWGQVKVREGGAANATCCSIITLLCTVEWWYFSNVVTQSAKFNSRLS